MSQPKNLEFLESYEVFPHPPGIGGQANYVPSHYCLRLYLQDGQVRDIVVSGHLIEALVYQVISVLGQYKDIKTHGP